MDQADTLRHLLGQPVLSLRPILGQSGSPQASLLAAAWVEEACAEGAGGLVVDASRDVLVESLGLKKRYELSHYLSGDVDASAVVLSWGQRRQLLPATRGISQLGAAQTINRQRLGKLLSDVLMGDDEICVALSHGQAGLAQTLCAGAPEWIWLVEPNRASVTECYKAMSLTGPGCGNIRHRVLVSNARSAAQADEVFAELERATRRFFANPLEYAGQYRGASCARVLRVSQRLEAIL